VGVDIFGKGREDSSKESNRRISSFFNGESDHQPMHWGKGGMIGEKKGAHVNIRGGEGNQQGRATKRHPLLSMTRANRSGIIKLREEKEKPKGE